MAATEYAVVEYRVNADGATETLDRLRDAANKADEAQRRQVAGMLGAAEKIDRSWQNMQGRVDPIVKAQIAMQRDLERVTRVGAEAQARLGVSAQNVADTYAKTRAHHERLIKNLRDQQKEAGGAGRIFDRLRNSVLGLAGAYAGMQGIRALSSMADQWSDLNARVGLAVGSMEASGLVLDRLGDVADRTYSALGTTVEAFIANSTALRELGYSTKQQLDYTEALNNALVVSGARGDRAARVQDALAKAMALGSLRGQELNTVIAAGGRVAEVIAEQLGVGVNQLRTLGAQGKITGDIIYSALTTRMEELGEQAEEMPATIEDGFQRIQNAMLRSVGQFDQATGASAALAAVLIGVADGIRAFGDTMVTVAALASTALTPLFNVLGAISDAIGGLDRLVTIAGAAIMGAFGPLALGAVASLAMVIGGALVNAIRAVGVAMMANPLSLLIGGITAAVTAIYLFRDEIKNAIGVDVVEITKTAINTVIGVFVGGYTAITSEWENLPAVLGDVGVRAGNALLAGIEAAINAAINAIRELYSWVNPLALAGKIAGFELPKSEGVSIPRIKNTYSARASASRANMSDIMSDALSRDYIQILEDVANGTRAATDATAELEQLLGQSGATTQTVSDEYKKLVDGAQARIDQLQNEIGLVGKAGLEADALRFKYDLLARAKEQNIKLGPDERAKIDELTESYRRLTTELAALEALEQINFDLSIMGLSEGDQRIMGALRRMGIEANSAYGQMVGGAMRYRDVQQQLQDEMKQVQDIGKDAFMSILDLLYETGDIGDKLIGIFANIGKEFAKMGMEKLWKSISGEGGSIFGGGSPGGVLGNLPMAGRTASGFAGVSMTSEMKAMNDNLQQVSKSALDVAKEFNGLNQHANAGALDAFMMASGTWKNLSAADTAWCAAFANAAIVQAGGQGTGSNLASSFLNWGQGTNNPKPGDIVVLKPQARGASGHVGFVAGFGDGTVQIFGGNQSKGANTKSFGLDQVAVNGFRTDPSLFSGAVSDGVQQGIKAVNSAASHMPEMAGGFAPGYGGPAQGGLGGMFGGGGMQGLMAGAGAFAGGMQSGDPLGGALSGGLGMMGAGFGPLGIAAGAVLGLVGGFLGKAKQKREELKKARAELEQQMGAITDLIARATGNFMGSYQKSLMESSDEFAKAIALAEKAKNTKLVKELNEAQDEFHRNIADRWARNFDGMIASMNAGMGLDSPFMSGMDAVEKMRESLVGFVNDAKMFSEAGDDLAGWVSDLKGIAQDISQVSRHMEGTTVLPEFFSGGIDVSQDYRDAVERWAMEIQRYGIKVFNEGAAMHGSGDGGEMGTPITAVYETVDGLRAKLQDFGVTFDETGQIVRATADAAAYAGEVERARLAAIETALRAISGADELTSMEEAVQKVNGVAANMASLLDDLGMSAEDAAKAIELHLLIAREKMRQALSLEVTRSINELSDFGWLNELLDAQDAYATRVRDFAAVGLDASFATQELNLRLKQIVSGAELTDDQLRQIATAFPTLTDGLTALIGMPKDFSESVDEAERDLRAAYDKQRSEITTTISRLERLTDTLKRFREEMRVNASSPLSQRDQMEEALKLFRDTAALALTGDEDAQERLTNVSQSALDEARAYYASSERYAEIWREIDQTLASVEASAGRQLTEAQRQLALLDDQVGKLIDINIAVLTVADAIAGLKAANDNHSAAQAARDAEMARLIQQTQTASADGRITALYKEILGRAPDSEGAAYYQSLMQSGMSWNELRSRFIANAQPEIQRGYPNLPGFSAGGFTGMIPTNEAAGIVHGQEFVMPAVQTRAYKPELTAMHTGTYRPGNDNGALIAAIGKLERKLEEQNSEIKRLNATVAMGAQATVSAVKEGNDELSDVSSQLKRANSR